MSKKNGDVIVYKATEEGVEVEFTALVNALEKSSLRQIALATGVSYNLALKAIKAPVAGVPYDPDFLNIAELERIILKHMTAEEYTNFDWSKCAEQATALSNEDFVKACVVGAKFTFRDGSAGSILYVTPTHVVFIVDDSTKPQVMSFGTFEHQGAKIIEEV